MKIKRKLMVAATSIALSFAAVFLPSGESIGSTVITGKYRSNHLVKSPQERSQELMVMQPVLFKSVLGNLGMGKDNFISCGNQERLPFTSSIELLIRLLIIGSFSSVGIVGYSSLVERSCQIINKNLKIIYSGLFLFLSLEIISSSIFVMSSPTSSISSGIRPSSSCSSALKKG